MLQSEILTVAEKPQKLTGILAARYQEDVGNSRIHERLDGIVNHRFVVDGEQVFIRHLGKWMKTAARPASQYHAFHRLNSVSVLRSKNYSRPRTLQPPLDRCQVETEKRLRKSRHQPGALRTTEQESRIGHTAFPTILVSEEEKNGHSLWNSS